MIYTETQTGFFSPLQIPITRIILGFVFILAAACALYAQTNVSQPNENTLVIENLKDSPVYSFGKNVIIKQHAKEVFAFGGDIIVEGEVDGDVGTIGGSVIQREKGMIGGDVIVIGGTYRPESKSPLRNPDKETIMFAVFEDQLRNLTQNPTQLFSPNFTPAFLAQRLLSVLFWFIVSLVFTTIAPGAVSRAITRFHISTLKVVAFGFAGFVAMTVGVIFSLGFLPTYLSAIVGLMAFVMLMLGYVFGRVALQVSVGKQLQKLILPEKKHSETLAILLGVIAWTIFLSVPYFWTFALLVLMSVSLGLVLTARSPNVWKKV